MRWFLNLPMWIRLTVGLSVVTGMFVMAWWHNQGKQKREVVWDDTAKLWPRLPLQVVWNEHVWDEHNSSITKAIAVMNSEVGCRLLEAASGSSWDITLISADGEPCGDWGGLVVDPDHAGQTYRCPDGTMEIHILQPGNVTQMYLVVYHELTHVLGLAHDGRYPVPERARDAPAFVPITADNAPAHAYRLSQGLRLPTLSDKDRAALSVRYCD